MKITIVLGTRPEIIKMSPIIKELESRKKDYFIVHTGQHYSYNLDRIFFEQLELPPVKYNLEVGSGSHSEEIARILIGMEKVFLEDRPDIILVEGDTNSVLAGALAASKLHVKVGHVEAGLRSYDRQMPEEINRTLTDHCSDYLFAPTEKAKTILLGEGIPKDKIFVTGNTIVDAIYQNFEKSDLGRGILESLNLTTKGYFLATLHRQENIDNSERFKSVLVGLSRVASEFHLPVIYPIHPHSRKMMKEFDINLKNVELVEPVGFFSFLQLENHAKLILTDSGGVQEEACVLRIPCVTLRDNTERPETIDVGANTLAGITPERIIESVYCMLRKKNDWNNPFGDGGAGKKIVEIITGANCA